MSHRYTILRAVRRSPTGHPFTGMKFLGSLPYGDIEPVIETAELTNREVLDIGRDPSVAAIAVSMPTRLIAPTVEPPKTEVAWGISATRADHSTADGSGVVVAVLDTGIAADHGVFSEMELEECDFSGDGDGDRHGHGTHCAGTIFGRDHAGTRIGVARGVKRALIGKVLRDDGSGTSEGLFAGMNWASEGGAQVISMSLGFDFPGMVANLSQRYPVNVATSIALEGYRANLRMFDAILNVIALREPFGRDAVVVAAAGNESRRPQYEIAVSVPAAANGVLSVGAVGRSGSRFEVAPFSNTMVAVTAPGVDVLSAVPGGELRPYSGTSMAAPHVAGIACLWWQALKSTGYVNSKAVVARLLATARHDVFTGDTDPADRGAGMVTAP